MLGGMFDPVHNGHLRAALEVAQLLDLAEVRLIPCAQPPHRHAAYATVAQRVTMLRLATAGEAKLVVDEREIERPTLSYSYDTLSSLRAEGESRPLCMIIGADAFLGLATWHRWRELLTVAHLIVLKRPGWVANVTGELAELMVAAQTEDPATLRQQPSGKILFCSVTQLEISSTKIRNLRQAGQNVRYLLPDVVYDYIEREALYL
ncbi:MAG: nicotinate-nucleotide adenylyltransferase [Halothiobacillaceae bacterium]|nr:MAG: nicotinate-nucleotide adenylyltransferase [Halothiobacillaceae bacterium]